MKIVSWNVAGLRAQIKKDSFHEFLMSEDFDIICIQETKAEETQVKLPDHILEKYSFRCWNHTLGTTQKKGFSGTTIWSSIEPIRICERPEFDEEGRIVVLEYEKFILVNVYVPNSQKFEGERYYFREKWNTQFNEYISNLQKNKAVIICGDMNVAHLDIDISNPKSKKNAVPGFFDIERSDFAYLLEMNNLIDIYRNLNPSKRKSTYWSNFLKSTRSNENGWRIDYFLVSEKLYTEKCIKDCKIMMEIMGSDHCPVILELN